MFRCVCLRRNSRCGINDIFDVVLSNLMSVTQLVRPPVTYPGIARSDVKELVRYECLVQNDHKEAATQ